MKIIALTDKCQHTTPSGAVRKVPKDWTGDFPEADAVREIEAGNALQIGVTDVADLRPDQVAVLAAAADNIIVQGHAEALAALKAAALDDMKVSDLKQLAAACGIELDGHAKKVDIVGVLNAARAGL